MKIKESTRPLPGPALHDSKSTHTHTKKKGHREFFLILLPRLPSRACVLNVKDSAVSHRTAHQESEAAVDISE